MSTTTTATTLVSSAATTALTTAFGTSSNGLNPPGRRLLARPSARNLKTPGIAVAGGRGGGIHTASTPNLNALYAAHANNNTTATAHSAISISNNTSRLAPPALSRKASLAALTTTTLTHTSLAAIPDATESYAFDTVLSDSLASRRMPPPLTPGKAAGGGDEIAVGDTVDVPGSMFGTVRFVGTVQGRKGTFAGVELHPEFASRGKNNGDVDGYVQKDGQRHPTIVFPFHSIHSSIHPSTIHLTKSYLRALLFPSAPQPTLLLLLPRCCRFHPSSPIILAALRPFRRICPV